MALRIEQRHGHSPHAVLVLLIHHGVSLPADLFDLRTEAAVSLMEFVEECLIFTGEDSARATLRLSVTGAFAKFERRLIREHQREGIALAKQRGAYNGRKKTLTPERAAELVQRAGNGVPKALLARDYGISRETVYQYLRYAKLE